MTINRHRAVKPTSSSWSTAEGSSTRTGPRRLAAFAAALAATVLMLSGTPAAAAPTFQTQSSHISAPPDVLVSVSAEDNFDNAGTNPRFTDVAFTATAFYSDSGIVDGVLQVRAMTAADLNALSSPPPNPFAVTATATMTNDEGETATGRFTFETYYAKQENTSSTPVGPAPTPIHETRHGVPGALMSHQISHSFNNAGTNPVFTDVTFDKPEYLDVPPSGDIVDVNAAPDGDSRFWVRVKTSEHLRAVLSPPPSPFTVKATATMKNDEGHTGTVTVTFTTNYVTQIADLPAWKTPSPSTVDVVKMPPGDYHPLTADKLFDNPGTSPRFTEVVLSASEYYDSASIAQSGVHAGLFIVQVKSLADLKAMDSLPASPIRVTATVTMINDEGATGTRTVTFETAYEEDEESEAEVAYKTEEPAAEPTVKAGLGAFNASAGALTSISADQVFDNAGTNAKFTNVDFYSTYYYSEAGFSDAGQVWVKVKTDAELNALDVVPRNPFTTSATVTMTNDEDQTATGTVSFKTTYVKPDSPSGGPTPKQKGVLNLPPGSSYIYSPHLLFENRGTNAKITGAAFSTLDYYDKNDTGVWGGEVYVFAKTAAQLNAMASPPPSTFTVDVMVTMTNAAGQTATNTLTFQTTYERTAAATTPTPSEPTAPPVPTAKEIGPIDAPAGTQVDIYLEDLFDNPGTNAKLTGWAINSDSVAAANYYSSVQFSSWPGEMLQVTVKPAADLATYVALGHSTPLTSTSTVTMTNDEDQTTTATLTLKTTLDPT